MAEWLKAHALIHSIGKSQKIGKLDDLRLIRVVRIFRPICPHGRFLHDNGRMHDNGQIYATGHKAALAS